MVDAVTDNAEADARLTAAIWFCTSDMLIPGSSEHIKSSGPLFVNTSRHPRWQVTCLRWPREPQQDHWRFQEIEA
jgi:hypothetical protein